jgi:hypothetical protein
MLHINQRAFHCNINSCSSTPVISGELRGSRIAVALGITVRAYAPALALCRRLIAAGHDPRTRLELFRKNGTLALTVRSIGEGAQLRIGGDGTRFEHSPDSPQGHRAASPMRRSAS